MKRNRDPRVSLALGCLAMLLAVPAVAYEVQLDVVQFPERQDIRLDFRVMARAPHARIKADVEYREGQGQIDISFEKMRPAVLFGGDVTCFVVWAVTRDGTWENLGELWVRDDSGSMTCSTGSKAFALMITAETHAMVEQPSELVAFLSEPAPEGRGARNSQLTFSAFAPAPAHELGSIADVAYTGETPLDLLQAQKAFELAQRMGAAQHAESIVKEARITLAQATNLGAVSGRRKEMVDFSRRTVALASEAMRVTNRKLEALRLEELIAQRRAEMGALEQRASTAEKARLETEEKLASETKELAAITAQRAALAGETRRLRTEKVALENEKAELEARTVALQSEREGLTQRLQGALSQVAETQSTARGFIVNLPDILYDVNEATLKPEAKIAIAKLSGILLVMPDLNLRVEGHTDSTGSPSFNMKLSQRRADSVFDFLAEQGISGLRMKAVGYGVERPIADNETRAGRAKNRRVEIVIASGEVAEAPEP